jgi:thiol-disulfide isomerase/thioredoxin
MPAISLAVLAALSLTLMGAPKKPAPAELNLKDSSGKTVRLRDLRGKVVVLNFWATWCGPCKEEMPMFVEVEKKWAARGVVFVGASLDERKTQKDIPQFLQKFQIDFPVWMGASGDDLDKLGMGEAVPATAFLNEDGIIFARVQGEIKREELEERLAWATGDRSGPAPKPLLRNL